MLMIWGHTNLENRKSSSHFGMKYSTAKEYADIFIQLSWNDTKQLYYVYVLYVKILSKIEKAPISVY